MWLIDKELKMEKIKLIVVAASLLCVGNVFAAQQKQQFVELQYEAKVAKKTTAKPAKKNTNKKAAQTASMAVSPSCQVVVSDLQDKRQNTVTLGSNGAEPLYPEGLVAWLLAVKEKELVGKTSKWSGSKQVEVIPSLTKLYAYAENMNIHGVMSLSIDYVVDGKVTTKKYRGMGSKINMMNGYGEYATALNYAVHELSPRIIADVKSFCESN